MTNDKCKMNNENASKSPPHHLWRLPQRFNSRLQARVIFHVEQFDILARVFGNSSDQSDQNFAGADFDEGIHTFLEHLHHALGPAHWRGDLAMGACT